MTTCGTCRHWHALPTNAQNLTDKRGECREGPPQTTTLPNIGSISVYPNLPEQFPACHQHQPKPVEIA